MRLHYNTFRKEGELQITMWLLVDRGMAYTVVFSALERAEKEVAGELGRVRRSLAFDH